MKGLSQIFSVNGRKAKAKIPTAALPLFCFCDTKLILEVVFAHRDGKIDPQSNDIHIWTPKEI